ncbi:hypothetical protein [Pseudomonas sp.]|uniref:hypothetical protein n=1 Tax=Pseudomonas sp. TaxID=306 RepID=UPI0035648923
MARGQDIQIPLVVGSILNLINQGEVLWGAAELFIPHVLLNYPVPFAVSLFSAMQARAQSRPVSTTVRTADVRPVVSARNPGRRTTD